MLASQGAARDRRGLASRVDPAGEADLFNRVAAGELRAFEALYRIYQPRLTRFLISMTHRPHLVEEVLNDTMFVVWDRPDSYNGASKLSTWIFAIAYRKALKALRRRDEPMEDRQAQWRPSLEADPEQELEQRQSQQVLLDAIGELSPDHRAVVNLCYFQDMGYREIATVMACPVDTVKTRMFHARRHLKTKLAGELVDWL